MKRQLIVAALLAAITVLSYEATGNSATPEIMSPSQPTTGAVAEPTDALLQIPAINYRKEWVQLGTFSVLADNPATGAGSLHIVYTTQDNIEAYLSEGVFPDGAVIVKDVFATRTEDLTTGTVSYADRLIGRFLMIKDAENRHAKDSSLWGDGWGWAFFEGEETNQTVSSDYQVDCLGCHEPARDDDLLYVRGYPVLNKR